ncbi:hypothetical protein [Desulforamulus ferrireducens]|uniref:Uncharacterized protein n=1 Tax=Desulforamulus ferrireducens TaxID=1833852 RepID=A0A1S6IVA3_9FIRM|nr:hypothetical protein [Desulforamulus ferrireducens]AQS58700.1 hypothetical protein B0537_06145 [Desulforamulus ferrireducens]
MTKALVNPYVVKQINYKEVQHPLPGKEISFFMNNELATAFVSDNFLTICRKDADVVLLGKIKYILFKNFQPEMTKQIRITTEALVEIDKWPIVTNGELELWRANKKLSLYHSSDSLRDHLLKVLFEQEKVEPGLAISVANLAAKMNTSRAILIPEILALEEAQMIERGGDQNFVHASDWIKITQAGDRYVDENFIIGGIKVRIK